MFRGDFSFLSNFHPCRVEHDGLTFASAEAAFQAAKFKDPAFRQVFTSITPARAKQLGKTRHESFRKDWNEVRIAVMREILEAKFKDQSLQERLIATGDTVLVENNTWGDTFWGVCNGRGENRLGRLLMEIRASL